MMKLAHRGMKKKKRNSNKGFTLVEVITSFAVLAIVSVALLQMFVLSTKTNRSAYDLDKANALCVELGEIYKADPLDNEFTVYSGVSTSAGITTYTRFYNKEWTSYTTTQDAKSEYKFVLEETTTASTSTAISYHPPFAWKGDIDPADDTGALKDSNISLMLSNPAGDIRQFMMSISGGTFTQNNVSLTTPNNVMIRDGTAYVPLQIQSDPKDMNAPLASGAVSIKVDNSAGYRYYDNVSATWMDADKVVADIYVCDAPTGSAITVVPQTGHSSVNFILSGERQAALYSADIRVNKILDGLEMAKNKVTKHLVR